MIGIFLLLQKLTVKVSVGNDLSIKIWKGAENEPNLEANSWTRKEFKWNSVLTYENAHNRSIYSVSWSKVNNLIATSGADNSIRVYQLNESIDGFFKLSIVAVIDDAHSGYDVNCVRWCPLKTYKSLLASCGDDEKVKIWSINC